MKILREFGEDEKDSSMDDIDNGSDDFNMDDIQGDTSFDDTSFDDSGFDDTGFDDTSFDDVSDDEAEVDDSEENKEEEDILSRIKNFISSKHVKKDKDGNLEYDDINTDELENSDKLEDNIKGFLLKIKDPPDTLLKYVKYNEDDEKYLLDVDSFFRTKTVEYKKLNAKEKFDKIKDDLYYMVNKFKRIYDKNISIIHIPNEIYQPIKDMFGKKFDEIYSDIEFDRYKVDEKDKEKEKDTNKEEKSDDDFVWEKKGMKKFVIPLNEDNYYAKSKGDLLELGFFEKEGWYVFIGDTLKIAVNIDFDVIVTTDFSNIINNDYSVEEKSFTNNISDGIVFASGIIGSLSKVQKELDILKKTFDIADKVKSKLFA